MGIMDTYNYSIKKHQDKLTLFYMNGAMRFPFNGEFISFSNTKEADEVLHRVKKGLLNFYIAEKEKQYTTGTNVNWRD